MFALMIALPLLCALYFLFTQLHVSERSEEEKLYAIFSESLHDQIVQAVDLQEEPKVSWEADLRKHIFLMDIEDEILAQAIRTISSEMLCVGV